MRVHKLLLAILLFSFAAAVNAAEFHTFKDTQGREMEAKIIRVSGEDVYIERRDGLSTRVKASVFSLDDQDYIKKWAHNALLKSGIFEVRFSEKRSAKRDSESGGIMREEFNTHYDITINNTAYANFNDIKIEYLIIKFEDALAAQKRSEGELTRLKGETSLRSIQQRSEVTSSTKEVQMLETKLAPGYVWKGGGKKTSKDLLKGIWVKIYIGGKLVHEQSRPENMMRKETW